MTEEEVIAGLAIIATYHPHTFSLTDEFMVRIWAEDLAPYDAVDVHRAIREMCREKDAFPSLKDILDRLNPNRVDPTEAWAIATRYASEWSDGPYFRAGQRLEPPGLSDPAIARAVEAMGGIRAIRARALAEEPAMRAHFFRAFEEASRTLKREERRALELGPVVGPLQLRDATAKIGWEVPEE